MRSDKPWFVICGGGTGGHLFPGLAVIDAIRTWKSDAGFSVFGTNRPIDEKLVGPRGLELIKQAVLPFTTAPWRWPQFMGAWRRSVKAARDRFTDRAPSVVLGLGGYAAGPAVVAAAKLRIPTAIFNPDAVPGRANRWLSSRVDRVFVQWELTGDLFPRAKDVRCTGCPIRPGFAQVSEEKARKSREALKLKRGKKTLLITGASQGARSINLAMLKVFESWLGGGKNRQLLDDWQIVHLTGQADLATCREKYQALGIDARALAFTEQMATCMAAADLVISRAGASTIAEIAAMGLPALLMPYPYDRKKHQLANAKVLVNDNAAELVEDNGNPDANAAKLREVLPQLMRSDQHRQRLGRSAAAWSRVDAADVMAQNLLEMAGLAE